MVHVCCTILLAKLLHKVLILPNNGIELGGDSTSLGTGFQLGSVGKICCLFRIVQITVSCDQLADALLNSRPF